VAENGKLQLKMVNAEGQFLGEKVDILLRNMILSGTKKASVTASKTVTVAGLSGFPKGNYRLEIDPPSYMSVNQFVTVKASGTTELGVVFPVDPKKVKSVSFPKFGALTDEARKLLNDSGRVLFFEGKTGETLYAGLDDIRRAGLMNILAKTRATSFSNGQNALTYVKELRELRGDRFFAAVSKELREETKNSVADGLFEKASGALHHLPASFQGFTDAGSFKTSDRYGNLQLTFFMKGDECVADIDIDDASGLAHVFQVLRNTLPGVDTHPYSIRDILLVHQKLDPGYTFKF